MWSLATIREHHEPLMDVLSRTRAEQIQGLSQQEVSNIVCLGARHHLKYSRHTYIYTIISIYIVYIYDIDIYTITCISA